MADHAKLKVSQIGPGFDGLRDNGPFNVYDLFQLYGGVPDFVMTYGLRYSFQFHGMQNLKSKKVHVCCDLTPPNEAGYKALLGRDRYDIFFAHSGRVISWLEKYGYGKEGDNIFFWPFGVDADTFKPVGHSRVVDVMTAWSINDHCYPERRVINEILEEEISNAHTVFTDRVFQQGFVDALNNARIVLNTTSIYNVFNMKILEGMACGALMLTQDWTDRKIRMHDFQDGVNIVLWRSLDELMDKIDYYSKHEKERAEIASKGLELVRTKNTNVYRAQKFGEILNSWT